MLLAIIIGGVLAILVALIAYWWHETHRKCAGADDCRVGEGCAGYYCTKCTIGNDCFTKAQNAEGIAAGLTVGALGCVGGTCTNCTSDAACPGGGWACDRNNLCNEDCNENPTGCNTGNCELSLDKKSYVCTAKCTTDFECQGSGLSKCDTSTGACLS